MNKRELQLKTIANEFARWQVQLENLNSLNLYDANLFSETSICEILNVIFDYELKNVNSLTKNHPAIDLADSYNRIAVQVTTTKSKGKVQSTLDKFFAKKMETVFDELLIIILGRKQKAYSALSVPDDFIFDAKKHILDFRDLLHLIGFLPTKRIEKIAHLLEQESTPNKRKESVSAATKVKQNLALKKKLKKDLLRKLNPQEQKCAMYVPSHWFRYQNVIIRSVDDTSWPNVDEDTESRISSWFKSEPWRFYDHGLELIAMGGRAIFDEEGNWDILDGPDDERKNNQKYRQVSFQSFLRIPYEYIVNYDMEPDNYYGVPTIFVEYANEGTPYEETLCGVMGEYDQEDEFNSRITYYFNNDKRRKLA